MILGSARAFTALGTADSDAFYPRSGIRNVLTGIASRAGTCRVHMFERSVGVGTSTAIGSGAVAAAAGEPNVFQLEGAYAGAGVGFFLRFTDTSNNAGTINFFAGDEAGG